MTNKEKTLKYRSIFFDLDRTLWDFDRSALMAFQDIFKKYSLGDKGIDSLENLYKVYSWHNERLWKMYRGGEITKEKLRGLRFHLTLNDFGINDHDLAESIGEEYLSIIALKISLFPNAIEILDYLKPKYHLYLITNGFVEVQTTKLEVSGLDKYFEEVVTSEEAGYKKPDRRIFDYALEKSGAKIELSLMIGDDPEVDILGAKNIGMDQVLFDPSRNYAQNGSTFYINDLIELKRFL